MSDAKQVMCHEWVPFDYDGACHMWACTNAAVLSQVLVVEGYCPTCGTQLHPDGTATPQVPWARAQQAERMLGECNATLEWLAGAWSYSLFCEIGLESLAKGGVCPVGVNHLCPGKCPEPCQTMFIKQARRSAVTP